MRVLFCLFSALLLSACGDDVSDYNIDVSFDDIRGNENAAKFILECAKNANPMSDEEGEDLVYGCRDVALDVYGKKYFYFYHKYSRKCISETFEQALECKKDYLNLSND